MEINNPSPYNSEGHPYSINASKPSLYNRELRYEIGSSGKKTIVIPTQNMVHSILSSDLIFDDFIEKVRQQKDANGQSNPRVTRSYIHAMVGDLKKSPAFLGLLEEFQKAMLVKINNLLHKNP